MVENIAKNYLKENIPTQKEVKPPSLSSKNISKSET
jgi:hypothetical protein